VSYARSGLAVENGLTRNAIAVLNAVREEFPELTQFGGVRPGDPGDHGTGHALDIMTSTSEGDAVARYLQSRAGELGIRYLIWKQRRWAPGGTWVPMEDRGSITANHYDHVHVSVR
ncbi:MAG TPA: ligand-binding protein SH3, partial [Pedococcus sp.]|nr:ligand-binding protein SH3 [Pedococcus sp.]